MKKIVSENAVFLSVLVLIGLLLLVCVRIENLEAVSETDALSRIHKNGQLRVITDNNANTYYLYRDQAMGFEYELAREFADFLQVELEVIVPGWNSMFHFLETGKGDVIAAGLTITPSRKKLFRFSQPFMDVQQRLIYHKQTPKVDTLADLEGKTIHVRRNTSYHHRLVSLKKQGIPLELSLVDNAPSEELIAQVAAKKINYTVVDSNIALLNRRYHPDIIIGIPMQKREFIGWAVNRSEKRLAEHINRFFYQITESGRFERLYNKYYNNLESFDYFDLKKFHKRLESRLPRYQDIIKQESARYGLDWRLVAAIVYQESHFDPHAKSFTGVRGLMQVTEVTAREMGISDRRDPAQSLEAGIKYLDELKNRFDDIDDSHERLLFAMASYNVGYGHVRDAQKLALERNLDPLKWASLEKTLPLLSKRKFYRHTTHGYARGREPVQHVQQILLYYDILKKRSSPPAARTIVEGEPVDEGGPVDEGQPVDEKMTPAAGQQAQNKTARLETG